MITARRRSAFVYAGFAAVFIVSVLWAWKTDAAATITAIPGAAALCGIAWQIYRDERAHERQLELKRREHLFGLSAAAHMANVAFDKHAAFCDAYVAAVTSGLAEKLLQPGPSVKALEFANDLYSIRLKHAPWVAKEVAEKLEPFEAALRSIGANAGYVHSVDPSDKGREAGLKQMYNTFAQVIGFEWQGAPPRPEIQTDHVLAHVQEALGIAELARMRIAVVRDADHALRAG